MSDQGRRQTARHPEEGTMRLSSLVLGAALLALPLSARADVTIGVLYPTSGFGASYGEQQQGAINLFMKKYGDLGPAGKLKLIEYDTRSNNAQAISLTRKLIESDGVLAIVGPYLSGASEVAFPVAKRDKTPIVTPTSAKPGIMGPGRPWAFRLAATTAQIDGALVAHWLKKQPKPIKTVVVFYDAKDAVSSSDGKNVFPPVLKKNGIKILDSITFQTGDIDYSGQVTRAKALHPDGIVVAAIYNEAGHLVAELRKQGMNQPIVAGLEILDQHFMAIAGAAAEGVMTATQFYRQDPKPAVVDFVKAFRALKHEEPTNSAGLMYDTLYLMRHCIVTTGVKDSSQASKDKIRDCWAGMKDVEAPLTGATTIDANGENVHPPTMLVVKDGQFTLDK
jgi:branched-chain amino acid transport system substrate-binding protein